LVLLVSKDDIVVHILPFFFLISWQQYHHVFDKLYYNILSVFGPLGLALKYNQQKGYILMKYYFSSLFQSRVDRKCSVTTY
jgi:hypothetical protein